MENLYFTEEHIMLRDMVREFAINEVRPTSQKIDKDSIFPEENIKKMSELGLMGIPWDQKYSGTGMDIRALVIAGIRLLQDLGYCSLGYCRTSDIAGHRLLQPRLVQNLDYCRTSVTVGPRLLQTCVIAGSRILSYY